MRTLDVVKLMSAIVLLQFKMTYASNSNFTEYTGVLSASHYAATDNSTKKVWIMSNNVVRGRLMAKNECERLNAITPDSKELSSAIQKGLISYFQELTGETIIRVTTSDDVSFGTKLKTALYNEWNDFRRRIVPPGSVPGYEGDITQTRISYKVEENKFERIYDTIRDEVLFCVKN